MKTISAQLCNIFFQHYQVCLFVAVVTMTMFVLLLYFSVKKMIAFSLVRQLMDKRMKQTNFYNREYLKEKSQERFSNFCVDILAIESFLSFQESKVPLEEIKRFRFVFLSHRSIKIQIWLLLKYFFNIFQPESYQQLKHT